MVPTLTPRSATEVGIDAGIRVGIVLMEAQHLLVDLQCPDLGRGVVGGLDLPGEKVVELVEDRGVGAEVEGVLGAISRLLAGTVKTQGLKGQEIVECRTEAVRCIAGSE